MTIRPAELRNAHTLTTPNVTRPNHTTSNERPIALVSELNIRRTCLCFSDEKCARRELVEAFATDR